MLRREGETREQMALHVARSHGRGLYFAHKIIACERSGLKGIMQVLKERNLWPENGRRSDGVSFLQCLKDSTRTVCNSGFEGKPGCCAPSALAAEQDFKEQKADCRKNLSAVDSWLSFTPSSTVRSILLSGTGVAASGMPGKIVSTP